MLKPENSQRSDTNQCRLRETNRIGWSQKKNRRIVYLTSESCDVGITRLGTNIAVPRFATILLNTDEMHGWNDIIALVGAWAVVIVKL